MKANTASRTAQYMALFRALETKRRPASRLFSDPWAIHFLDKGFRRITRLSAISPVHRLVTSIIQHRIPGALASGVARTRYIDELLLRSIQNGSRQVIILGAGFDTRAVRLAFLQNMPVIEIDHPDTARIKKDILHKTLHQLPSNTRYLQIDFNTQSLAGLLDAEKIDFALPTTIIWEGVTNYLSAVAMDSSFALLGRFAKGSSVIFTYVHKQVLEEPAAFFGAEKLLDDLDAIEERWTFGFYPHALPGYLRRYGFLLAEDTGAADYRRQYLPGRAYLFKGYEFYRVAYAQKV
jgi:methyltransferase (TIGR00027 family)